jgi:hypothetical protein
MVDLERFGEPVPLTSQSRGVYNIGMKRKVRRILVHLCSLLVLMPFGWCCWLPVLRAQESSKEKAAENPAPCCCCVPKPAPAPEQPKEESPQTPSCCCEPQPAALLSAPVKAPTIFDALAIVASVVGAPITLPFLTIPAEIPGHHANSPPLHLLHCLWLC